MNPVCLKVEPCIIEEILREIFSQNERGTCLYNQLLSFGMMLSINGAAEHQFKSPMES